MNKRLWLIAVLTAILLIAGYTVAMAAHPDVSLKNALGDNVGTTEAYSPKQTCAGCHISGCGTGANSWCANEVEKAAFKSMADYGTGEAYSTHVQGVLGSTANSTVTWKASRTKSFAHGVSVGKHMNQGRNEDYTNTYRAQFGDLYFTSSPGMYGKY